MVNIQNSAMIIPIAPAFNPVSTISTSPVPIYSNSDSFVASASDSSDLNKKAGMFQRMMHGIGNGLGRIADAMGMGNFSQFAKAQFKLYDIDNNNHINAGEFTAVSSIVQKTFQEVDRNTNQEVSFGEFKSVVRELVDAELKRTDINSDGFVNFNEAAISGNLGYKQTQIQIEGTHVEVQNQVNEQAFKQHDTNSDGLLSKSEFTNLLMAKKLKPQSQTQIG